MIDSGPSGQTWQRFLDLPATPTPYAVQIYMGQGVGDATLFWLLYMPTKVCLGQGVGNATLFWLLYMQTKVCLGQGVGDATLFWLLYIQSPYYNNSQLSHNGDRVS